MIGNLSVRILSERVETLRGLACVLLVSYHVIGASTANGMQVEPDSFWRIASNLLTPLRMPLFAFVSGLVLLKVIDSTEELKSFWLRRLSRLGLPLIFVSPLFQFASCLAGSQLCHGNPITNVVMPYAHFWFLQSSILIALLLGALIYLLRSKCFCFGLMGLPVSMLVFLYMPNPSVDVFSIIGVYYLLPFVLLGIVARENQSLIARYRSCAVLIFAFSAVLLYYENWNSITETQLAGSLQRSSDRLALSCSLVLLLYSLSIRNQLLAFVGGHAYAIFLFHPIVTGVGRRILIWLGHEDTSILLFVTDLVLGIVVPVVAQRVLLRFRWTAFAFLGELNRKKRLEPAVSA